MAQQAIIIPGNISGNIRKCIVAIGSNQPFEYIQAFELVKNAVTEMGAAGLQILRVSRFYESPAFPAGSGPDYVNAAVLVASALAPRDLLAVLHGIEQRSGRDRQGRWGPRTLDLDLIDCGGLVLPDARTYEKWASAPPEVQRSEAPGELVLPHPRLQDRGFVLLPLRDVAPDWVHPVSGLGVDDLIAALDPDILSETQSIDRGGA